MELHRASLSAGCGGGSRPHQLRHAHAVELLHEGIPLPLIQRQATNSQASALLFVHLLADQPCPRVGPSITKHWPDRQLGPV
jgi:integrase